MADVQSNIHVNIDTSDALASLKLLQRQISAFHTQMAKSGTAANAVAANQAQNLMNSINATGQFQASMRSVKSSTESFTEALEKNKLTSREYFRYTGAATKTFGRLFRSEFETINKVARERVKDIQTQYIKLGRGANGALQAIAVRPLTLDMQNLGTQTAMAAQKQQLLNQLLKQGSTNLLNFGKNTQWAGRQLMVGFTVPLVMLGTQAGKTFMKLEEQAIRFKRVYGELFTTQEETDAMVKQIQLLAKEYTKYGVAVEETMKMAADAAAMGKMGADLTAQVAQATRLAVLGGVEQAEALETTISVTNAFGVATEDLAKKIDFLNAVENQTVVSIEDLTIAIPKAGPVVKQLGGDVEDLAFFLTAMKEGGINASEGANALKSGLASLINPSEKASKMLMGLGVNIKGIVEANAGDVKSTVVDFANALDTLDPLNRARAIEQLFGKFQFSRLSTLFQNVTAEGTQASRVLGLTKATTEELAILSERELSRIENTTTYKFKKSIEDLKVTLAPVGEQFLKALTPIVEFASKILDKFNDLGDGSKKFLTILTVALGAVGPVALMAFGLLANGVANIIKMFANMKSVFNKAGSSTQVLGQQTDYLTQQQLEASAVAASLDQVHQKLKQTFTSEASAVTALAAAYQRAIAAQAGFTGPVRGGKPGLRKYSTGTTKVPGQGNQDTVPAMLTPGEAVIPAQAAQDPANRPIIARMIAGQIVQGFNTGTGNVQPDGSERLAFAHAAAPIAYNNLNDIPDEFGDKRSGYQARGVSKAYGYTGIGFDIPATLNSAMDKSFVDVRAYEAAIRNPESIKTMTARLMGPPLQLSASEALRVTTQLRSNLLASLSVLPDGTPINDKTIYRRMGSIRKGILGGLARDPQNKTIVQRMLDPHGIGMGSKAVAQYNGTATPEELRKAVAKAKNADKILPAIDRLIQYHPNSVIEVTRDANGNITDYKRPEVSRSNPTKKPTKFNSASLMGDGSFSSGRSGGDSGSVSIKAKAKPTKAALQAIRAVDGITTYGKKDTDIKDVGRSNPKHRHITGVYETADGKGKVFVKPMINLENALAEQRAASILRDAHGLDVPEQKITMVKDPVTKRLVYALESAFDPKFAGKNMPVTFSQDEYFRQLLASSLRGDKDLGRGNLGGKMAPDVGTAYVYDEATQYNKTTGKERVISDAIKSVGHQALINVGGVAGSGAKKFFADATRDIALSMSPDEYQRRMVAEIDRVLPKLKETIAKFGLTGEEAKPYKAIIERLEDARNNVDWRKIHTAHTTAGKVAITPDELILNKKTKKTRKPKKEKLPKNAQSSGGPKDKVMTTAPKKDEQVVKPSKPSVRAGKLTIKGHSDAPTLVNADGTTTSASVVAGAKGTIAEARTVGEVIGKTISQSAALASRTLLYGTGPIDADAKSVRRQLEKRERARQRQEAKTQAKAAASRTALYGTGPIDAIEKSKRRNAQNEMRRSELAAKAAYKQSVIDKKAAEEAQKRTVKGRLQTFNANRQQRAADRVAAGKGSGMGMAGAMGIASGVAMMGSMAPGKVGEISQKIMMPLMGMAMILPLLQNKFAALTVGIGLVIAAYAYQRIVFDKAQDAALELTEAMGSGTKAIKSLSEFAGTVSAGEIMDRKRKEAFSPFQIKTGKKTFGESFMEGEDGKAMAKNVGASIKASGSKQVAKDQLVSQMATSVAAGALSPAQARSIVANLAQEMGDYSFGIEVNGKLNSLLGPNGENILKDPIGVRVEILKGTRERMNLATDRARQAGGWTAKDAGKSAGYTAAGAGVGAIGGAIAGGGIGGLLGSFLGPAGTAAGAVLGAKVGAVAGTVIGGVAGNLFGRKDRNKRIGEASGATVAMQKMALEQQQEMLDSVELQYMKEMEILKAKGDQNKMDELSEKYADNKLRLLEENAALVADIQKNFKESEGATRDALMTGADKAITKRYKGTELEDVVPLATTDINDSNLKDEMKYVLKMEMASGQIDPLQMIEIFDKFGEDDASMEAVATVITKFGGKFANQAMGIISMFKDPKQSADFIARISSKDPEGAAKDLELFQKIAQSGQVMDLDVALNYYNTNETARTNLMTDLAEIDALKGKVSLTVAATVLGEKEMEALRANNDYFKDLDPVQQKVYMQQLRVMFGMEGDPDMQKQYKNWLAESGNKGKTFTDFVNAKTEQVTEISKAEAAAVIKEGTTDNSKGPDSSPLDDLLKRLRDVRKNQIQVTKGFQASSKALDKLFGGKKTISIYSGIENDLRGLGAGEDLIELIVGMDPKEYQDQKDKLFKFDEKGNISKIKDSARSIGDALQSVKLGEFVSEQEKMAKQIGSQVAALQRLQAAGVEGSVALEAVADATFAAAVANKKLTDTELKKIVKAADNATKAKKRMAAIELSTRETTELEDRAKILAGMTKNLSQFSQDQRSAILESPALQAVMIEFGIDNERFKNLLQNATNKANIELKIKAMTIDGMQDIFDEGFSNAMESFDVKEKQLQLQFDIDTKQLNKEIDDAQNKIALAQFKIDDKEADLKRIADQEEKINEKYDKRIDALDEVEKINDSISRQQKGQLSLADALTSGDIAAAARAAQEMRAEQAADAVTKQKAAVEKSRELELSSLRSKDGKTRKELEAEIKQLQDEIFEIEEKQLEPAAELVRLRQIKLAQDIENLTVLGKTRDAWEGIKNLVDLARISSEKFVKSMQDALDVLPSLINAYNNDKSNTEPIVNAAEEPTPTATPTPTPNPTQTPPSLTFGPVTPPKTTPAPPKATPKPTAAPSGKVPGFVYIPDKNGFHPNPKPVPAPQDKDKNGIPDNIQAPKATPKATPKPILPPLLPTTKGKTLVPGTGVYNGSTFVPPQYRAKGGIIPKMFALGGFAKGTDTIPAMLTPGEFVMSKYAVDTYGVDNMNKINNGDSVGGTVYNNTYTLTVNAKTDANPNDIAQAVMSTIKKVDDRRIRGVSLNGR